MEVEAKYYTLSNDKMFKNVFLRNTNLLEWLINGIMRNIDASCSIKILSIENVELFKDRMYIKNKTIDSLIDTNYAYFNIELNNKFNHSRKIRNLFYLNSIYINKVKVNQDYSSIDKPTIQINLNLEQKKTKHFISKYLIINEYCTLEKYDNLLYIINIDVARMVKFWYNDLKQSQDYFEKYKYILIIGLDKDFLNSIKEGDKMIDTIKREIDDMNRDVGFYQALTDEEDIKFQMNTEYRDGLKDGEEKGIKKGIEKGIKKGKEQANINNARKMKREHIPVSIIKRITGLDAKTIMTL